MLTALGEELGWRGYMLPALNKLYGFKKAIIITNLFWCLWHFPLLIWGSYMSGTPILYRLFAFTLCIFSIGVIASILTIKSGSIWPAALLHAAHNNIDQLIFAPITTGDNSRYFVSETGIFTIIIVGVIAICMYLIEIKRN